jgi:hypothetical protein
MNFIRVFVALWAMYNITVTATCTGRLSPFYWPPIAVCYH